jgi:hypothetical protein
MAAHWQRLLAMARGLRPKRVVRFDGQNRRYMIGDVDEARQLVWVREFESTSNLSRTITKSLSARWTFEGEPPVQVVTGEHLDYGRLYAALDTTQAPHLENNLRQSDSSVCLVGRTQGEAATRQAAMDMGFRHGDSTATLAELVTVEAWSPGRVSRMTYFNTRTGRCDRDVRPPKIVIADGDGALFAALQHEAFRESDIIGVVQKTIDHERLAAVSQKLSDLGQWYDEDSWAAIRSVAIPKGVSVRALRRRAAQ